jgi:hypothetical protein
MLTNVSARSASLSAMRSFKPAMGVLAGSPVRPDRTMKEFDIRAAGHVQCGTRWQPLITGLI